MVLLRQLSTLISCSFSATILSGGYPEFIWLSIGGDDIIDGWLNSICKGNSTGPSAATCYETIYTAMDTMLGAIFKALPLVQVGILGYDFTNFVATTQCQELGLLDFKGLDQLGINDVFLGYADHVLTPLAHKYNAFQFQYLPLWGTLQVRGRGRQDRQRLAWSLVAHCAGGRWPIPDAAAVPQPCLPIPVHIHERRLHSLQHGGVGYPHGEAVRRVARWAAVAAAAA